MYMARFLYCDHYLLPPIIVTCVAILQIVVMREVKQYTFYWHEVAKTYETYISTKLSLGMLVHNSRD